MKTTPACPVEPPAPAPAIDPLAPPRYANHPGKCRVGDWEYPAFIFAWYGRSGIQRYQPGREDPFDEDNFDPVQPVWLFERCPHPSLKYRVRGQVCDVWMRVG